MSCAFCGTLWGIAGRSDEHVWPQWMRKEAGAIAQGRLIQGAGFSLSSDGRFLEEIAPVSRSANSSLLHVKTREVCRVCNNGWMSALESQARPIFLSLAKAAETGLSVVLSQNDRVVLA